MEQKRNIEVHNIYVVLTIECSSWLFPAGIKLLPFSLANVDINPLAKKKKIVEIYRLQ